MTELLATAESLKALLVARATGNTTPTDGEYKFLRTLLLSTPSTKPFVPAWLLRCRTLLEFWGFIRPKFKTYAERREFLMNEFDPLLTALEEGAMAQVDRMDSVPNQATVDDVDIGILTIREDEFRAVLAAFPNDNELRRLRRHYNIRTADAGGGQTYRIALLRQVEQGNGEAQDAARDMIEELRPTLIIVVGIAGGLPHDDFTLGDVVVSTRINDYSVEARKEGEAPSYNLSGGPIASQIAAGVANLPALDEQLGDWTSGLPTRPSVAVDGAEVKGPPDWQDEVRKKLAHHFGDGRTRAPVATAGILASSDRLVKDPIVLFPWIQTARHTLAIEMESAGVHRAARERTFMLAIRGISDIVGLKRDEAWTKYACATAAAFTRAYLRTTPVTPKSAAPPPRASGPQQKSVPASPKGASTITGWLTPVAQPPRSDRSISALSWRLEMAGATPFEGTKAELHDALTAAIVTYDLANFGRTARWPRPLTASDAKHEILGDGTQLWTRAYRTGVSNETGDEQLALTREGTLTFQRDVFWDVDDLAVDLGRLAEDVMFFLIFAQRFVARTNRADGSVTIGMRAPTTPKGLAALFHSTPLQPDQPERAARLHGVVDVGGKLPLPTTIQNPHAHAMAAKALLDRVANEFTLEPPIVGGAGAPNFLSLNAQSLMLLASQLRIVQV